LIQSRAFREYELGSLTKYPYRFSPERVISPPAQGIRNLYILEY